MKCDNCGQDIVSNSKFCSNCGEAISIKEEYVNDDLKMESKKFEFNERSKLTWYGYTTTEVICKEEEVNIRKVKTLFLSKEKMNKDIKYSDIKSLEYKSNLSIVYSGLGALVIVLGVSLSYLYLILIGALLFFLSFERILYINDKEIKIKDSSIKNNKFTEFISIIEKKANITAQVSSKKQNIVKSIIKIVLGLIIMASFYGAITLLTDGVKGKEYIDIVKNGSFDNYPNIEIGEAFENYFDNPKWRYFVSDKDIDVVEFTGKCMYDNAEVTALIQFTIDNNSRFEAKYFSMNDVSQNLLMMYGIIDAVMEESNINNTLDSSYTNESSNKIENNSVNNNGYLDEYEYDLTGEEFKSEVDLENGLYDGFMECKLNGSTKIKDSKLINNTKELNWEELYTTERGEVVEVSYTGEDYLSYIITLLFTHDGMVLVTDMEAQGRSFKMTKDDKINELNVILGK